MRYSTTLTLTGNTTDFTTSFHHPIRLDPMWEHEAAFLSLETYNSIPNITHTNNVFKYSTDNGKTWKIITLPEDAYEYVQIENEIQRQMVSRGDYNEENKSFYIDFTICRLSSVIEIRNPNYVIDFNIDNSIGSTLGFGNEILSYGTHKSPNIVDINRVNTILVNVDFIEGGYVNKTISASIHNFSPKVGPGYKIIEKPSPELIFYRVSKHFIPDVRIWLTDQNSNLIDLQGERITVRILIRSFWKGKC